MSPTNYWWQKKAEYDALVREYNSLANSKDKNDLLDKMDFLLEELSNPNLEAA
jgi:hypothetical protein